MTFEYRRLGLIIERGKEYPFQVSRSHSHTSLGPISYGRASGEWKTNTGTSVVFPLQLTDQYKLWADEASQLFGGMDILSVDAVHTVEGEEYILEVNGSSSGFMPDVAPEDNAHVREVVLQRMSEAYPCPEVLEAAAAEYAPR